MSSKLIARMGFLCPQKPLWSYNTFIKLPRTTARFCTTSAGLSATAVEPEPIPIIKLKAFERSVRDDEFPIANEILESILRKNQVLPVQCINLYFRRYSAYNKTPYSQFCVIVHKLCDFMEKIKIQPDVVTLNTIISAFGRKEIPLHAITRIDLFRRFKVQPTVETLDMILEVCSKAVKLQTMIEMLNTFSTEFGVKPAQSSYNLILSAYFHKGIQKPSENVAAAERLYNRMIHQDGLTPNKLIYATMIRGYGSARRMYKAEALWKDMAKRGIKPDLMLYNAVLDGYCRDNNMSMVKSILADMKKDKIEPDTQTYNLLLTMYGKHANWDSVDSIWQRMISEKKSPDSYTFTALINACAWCHKGDLIETFWNQARFQYLLQHTAEMWSSRVRAFLHVGKFDKAVTALEEFKYYSTGKNVGFPLRVFIMKLTDLDHPMASQFQPLSQSIGALVREVDKREFYRLLGVFKKNLEENKNNII